MIFLLQVSFQSDCYVDRYTSNQLEYTVNARADFQLFFITETGKSLQILHNYGHGGAGEYT